MGIIPKIPTMKIRETVNLWLNAIKILSDPAKEKRHAEARQAIDAVYNEWIRRRSGRVDPAEMFDWPSTDAAPGTGGIETKDWQEIGFLKFMGYTVDNTEGIPPRVRERILSEIFTGPIPPVFSNKYLDECGEPSTAFRLKKMAETIAALTRNARRRRDQNMDAAIRNWEKDLDFLYWKYYVEKFQFDWPNSKN
jgi:hypothetical protein